MIYSAPALLIGFAVMPAVADSAGALVDTGKLQVIGTALADIDADAIQAKQASDLEDLFRDQPNITVGGGLGVAQKIYLRGIQDTKLNVSIDGASQTGQLFQHQGRISVDPDLLKRVEVNAGAGSALNGFGALGGAIKFVTKDAEDFLARDQQVGALLKTRYQSNNEEFRHSASLYGRLGADWSALVSLGKADSDLREDGNGDEVQFSETDQETGLFKLSGALAPGHRLTFSHDRREEEGERNLMAEFIYLPPWNTAGRQKSARETSTARYEFNPASALIDLSVTAYRTENEMALSNAGSPLTAEIETTGFDLRNTSLLDRHELTYGIEYRKDKARNLLRRAQEEGEVYGLYIQGDYALTDALLLSMGARYDHYELDDADGQHFSSDGVSPNANLTYQLNDRLSVYGGYATAFRSQTTKQALSVGSEGNRANLKEETASNTELGVEYRNQGFTARAEVFRSEIEDVVSLVGPPGPFPRFYENVGELETRGVNLFLQQAWERARLSASYSKTEPELNGQPLNDADFGLGKTFGDSLVLNASYQFPQQALELGWSSKFVKAVSATAERPQKPSYDRHDLYLRWAALPQDQLTVDFAINNIFDEFYYDHGTFGFDNDFNRIIGIPESGRDLRLTLSWKL